MKSKKWMKRVVALAACTAIVSAGAQAFAATSDSYTGFTTDGELSATITCEIASNDGVVLHDYCTASTQSAPKTLEVQVMIGIMNAEDGVIVKSDLKSGEGKVTEILFAHDQTSAAWASSVHIMQDITYGHFLYNLTATFENG